MRVLPNVNFSGNRIPEDCAVQRLSVSIVLLLNKCTGCASFPLTRNIPLPGDAGDGDAFK